MRSRNNTTREILRPRKNKKRKKNGLVGVNDGHTAYGVKGTKREREELRNTITGG
jgi:hypothetical protein